MVVRVGDEGHHTGRHRREPQPHQQRCRQRSRRAEPGRAFDEGAEEVADDDGLDAWVRGDGLEAAADDVHEPGFFQSVLEEDGSRHDEQQVHRLQDAVDGVSRRVQGGDLPDEVHQQDGEQEGDAHRLGGGDVAQDHQEEGQQQRDGG